MRRSAFLCRLEPRDFRAQVFDHDDMGEPELLGSMSIGIGTFSISNSRGYLLAFCGRHTQLGEPQHKLELPDIFTSSTAMARSSFIDGPSERWNGSKHRGSKGSAESESTAGKHHHHQQQQQQQEEDTTTDSGRWASDAGPSSGLDAKAGASILQDIDRVLHAVLLAHAPLCNLETDLLSSGLNSSPACVSYSMYQVVQPDEAQLRALCGRSAMAVPLFVALLRVNYG